MKLIITILCLTLAVASHSQYYYKDILSAREASDLAASYQKNKVKNVLVYSYDSDNERIPDLTIQQQYYPGQKMLITKSGNMNSQPSVLVSSFDDANRIIRATDSSTLVSWTTEYKYNGSNQLISISVKSTDSARSFIESEEHLWKYEGSRPAAMVKIKNGTDSTFVAFKLDEKGNVVEEQETRKGKKSAPVYYYYDDKNRLTDIVRFNEKAGRLLPEYLFEYSADDKLIQKITVPANSSEYIIWRYLWDERGLKTREAIYNKQKQLTARIEYQYGFGS